jgi:hypothetical protein
MEGSDAGSDDQFTTALPHFAKESKEKKDRGLKKILPFNSRRKDKERKEDKGKERERSVEGRGGSSMGRGGGETDMERWNGRGDRGDGGDF